TKKPLSDAFSSMSAKSTTWAMQATSSSALLAVKSSPFGIIVFAVFATGGQILAGQIALGVRGSNRLCTMLHIGVFAIPTLILAMPRTLDQLSWLSVASVICIIVAGIVGMTGAGVYPIDGWRDQFSIVVKTEFVSAFISVTNPVFAYAGKNSHVWTQLHPLQLMIIRNPDHFMVHKLHPLKGRRQTPTEKT
ncbi:MAG: hypothetical protein Q9173_007313, partial [Seirophora scorigena]